MKKLLAVLMLAFALSGCMGPYVQHPGSHSIFESKIYDVINDSNNALNIARPQLASGALPARFKPAFDALAAAYSKAYPILQAYDKALDAGQPTDALLAQLNAANAILGAALTTFKGVK